MYVCICINVYINYILYSIFFCLFCFILFCNILIRNILMWQTLFTFRDIMDSLSKIGDLVKATEFIGQSSGIFSSLKRCFASLLARHPYVLVNWHHILVILTAWLTGCFRFCCLVCFFCYSTNFLIVDRKNFERADTKGSTSCITGKWTRGDSWLWLTSFAYALLLYRSSVLVGTMSLLQHQ